MVLKLLGKSCKRSPLLPSPDVVDQWRAHGPCATVAKIPALVQTRSDELSLSPDFGIILKLNSSR